MLFTLKVKTSVRAPNVTNVGWDVTFGHADHPMPRLNSACRQAVESASGVQMLLPKRVRLWLIVTLKPSYLTVHILGLHWLETRRRIGSTIEHALYLLDAEI